MNREAERKKLVELLKDAERKYLCNGTNIPQMAEFIADYLLDNDVGVKPHCKAGKIVYLAIKGPKPQIETKIIESIVIGMLDDKVIFTDGTCFTMWHKDWGLYNNTVFTSREDALKALEGKEDDGK